MTDEEDIHSAQRDAKIMASLRFADWLYHDVRLDCDGLSEERTLERLHAIDQKIPFDALFSISCGWSLRAYWRIQSGWKRAGQQGSPEIQPQQMLDEKTKDDFLTRNVITAQQFISSVCRNDFDMAEAIFRTAYDSSEEDRYGLTQAVLLISLNMSDVGKAMGRERKI